MSLTPGTLITLPTGPALVAWSAEHPDFCLVPVNHVAYKGLIEALVRKWGLPC